MGQDYDGRRLWELLSELVAQQQTGTLYIKSDDAHAGMIMLKEGEIVSVMYRSEFGAAAVELLQQGSRGTCRFDVGGLGVKGEECPPTAEVLLALAPPGQTIVGELAGAARPVGGNVNFQGFLTELSGHLQSHIGPIASMVVNGAVEEMGRLERIDQAESLISRLLGEIDDPDDSSAFLSAALDSLKKVQGSTR